MKLRRVVTVGKEEEIQCLARQISLEVFAADDLIEALDIVDTINPELVLFDHSFSPVCIRELLNTVKNNDIHVVAVGRHQKYEPNIANEFIQIGAYDYIHGTPDYPRIKEIAKNIKNKSNTTSSTKTIDDFFVDPLSASIPIVGRSEAIVKTINMIKLVAASRCNPVLIVGETGTGKELAAKAVHAIRCPNEPFIAVNCAALTANLMESELFGHVKGSFTSADREKTGLLELAGAGSIFLDEISEMSVDLQAKLLRVFQEKTFRKVGGTKDITCKATIITSSNRNLRKEVQAKRFRQDLYYRLNTCPINIAPLRLPQRRKDIPLLVQYFLKTSTICPEKTNKITAITKLAIEALQQHDWPGNVRELRNVIERAILLETTDKIGLSSIMVDTAEFDAFSSQRTDKLNDFSLEKAERELIARALQQTNWQKTKAASMLGISRATLYAKVRQHNIEQNSNSNENSANQYINETSLPSSLEPATAW